MSSLGILEEKSQPPSHLHPPRSSACSGCSPPLLLPLSSGSRRTGVPPFLFPSCCLSRRVSQKNEQTNTGPNATRRKIGRYWADLHSKCSEDESTHWIRVNILNTAYELRKKARHKRTSGCAQLTILDTGVYCLLFFRTEVRCFNQYEFVLYCPDAPIPAGWLLRANNLHISPAWSSTQPMLINFPSKVKSPIFKLGWCLQWRVHSAESGNWC